MKSLVHPIIFFVFAMLAPALRAQVIRVAFHNGATTTSAMVPTNAPTTQGSVVNTATQTWNNVIRNSGTVSGVTYTGVGLNFSNFVLKQENGTDSLARLEVKNANGSSFANNGWGTANKDYVMMEGSYQFATSTATSDRVVVSAIPAALQASGYVVTLYGDIATARTMNYTLSDGTTTQTLTLSGLAGTFNGTFVKGENFEVSTVFSGPVLTMTFDTAQNTGSGVSALGGMILQPAVSEITAFTAAPASVQPGGTTTLAWTTTGYDSFSISPGVGDVTAQTVNGNGSVAVTVNAPTTFTLTASKTGVPGSNSRTVTVGLLPPTIHSFTASPSSITSGGSTTLTWQTSGATVLNIAPGLGNQTQLNSGSSNVSPAATTVYTLTAGNATASATARAQIVVDGVLLQPRISEFVAVNDKSLIDGNGAASDWIELENPNLVPLDISGYHLTDDITALTKWTFPAGTILPAGGVLIVFASSKTVSNYIDPLGYRHTNFSLNNTGESLALVAPNGATVIQAFSPAYPRQVEDVSFSPEGYYTTPTPGVRNVGTTVEGLVSDTVFSVNRGFHSAPINVAITCTTPETAIYFTTDGTTPSLLNGTLYSAPVAISTTTTLRAAAFRDGWLPSNVDTHTYIYTTSVITQGNAPPGYPSTWAGKPADYEMDPQVINHPDYTGQFDAALKALPTLSVVMAPDDMFGPQGIYQNPLSEGDSWERAASAEFFVPDGSESGFHINCGIRVQGASSRNPDTPKHPLSLRFRSEYGSSKLRYNLFKGQQAVDEFDLLQLRPESNHGFTHRHYYQCSIAQYNRDQWTSDLFTHMGQRATHGRWAHLYLNGIYWGLYDIQERPDADFMAAYYGGVAEDYDVLNSGVAMTGNTTAYSAMFAIANGNIADNSAYQSVSGYLDIDAFIDYMLLNFYIGNRDWDSHNWRAGRRRQAGAGFVFVPWDGEFAISPNNAGVVSSPAGISGALNTDATTRNNSGNPSALHQRLTLNAEYRLRFADRARRHLLDGGALSPSAAAAVWQARSVFIDNAIIAESARWGDFRRDVDPGQWTSAQFALYTKNDHYLPTQNYILSTYLPQRSGIVLAQLTSRNLYPAVSAPAFSQYSSLIAPGFTLSMNGASTIHFTTDGTDPRDVGGAISSSAQVYTSSLTLNSSTRVKARSLSGGVWSALTEAYFSSGDLKITEIMYRPSGNTLAEYLEITNTGPETIQLAGLRFTAGITFDFTAHSSFSEILPGQRILLVRDPVAFRSVYGTTLDAFIAGTFQNDSALSNSGETLTLVDSTGIVVQSFAYNNGGAWPNGADGGGYALVYTGGNPADPGSWRHSTQPGGSPASSDSLPLTSSDLLGYAIFSSPSIEEPTTLSFTRRAGADATRVIVTGSGDLNSWDTSGISLISTTLNPQGHEVLTYAIAPAIRRYFRAEVSTR